ncbi:MAG TPA: L-seryl-tRNA(Sec) selenium transferase [Pyrinomonadaceae bacterium]|nr:L-seryl-tRNA(Sec) selenium transferase [Pyrinomonadaceae bacterium]
MSNPATASLRAIPSVDQLLRSDAALELRQAVGVQRLTVIAREITDQMRTQIESGALRGRSKEALLAEGIQQLHKAGAHEALAGFSRVINATGVILHTNLGRAPLSAAARTAVANEAAGYCTLEYDLSTGERGKRGGRAEELLVQLTGAEAALIVNNCASAALLILTVLAHDGETIVSRGELVEIGGDFRVPDVMATSGTRLIEVGTTNRTRLEDYRQAINENTRLLMRVHPSNYRIVGFTTSPDLTTLSSLAHEAGLFLYEDAGSGAIADLTTYGLGDEPIISESLAAGADVVTFSGDKLLGGPQAGLIVGRSKIIERLRSNSLYRALRADKLCLAALEATLDAHRRGALDEIPTLHMLSLSAEVIEKRARNLIQRLEEAGSSGLKAKIIEGHSAVGGGSGPNVHPSTALVALDHESLNANEVESRLRAASPPVISRIADGHVLLDLRTVDISDESELMTALKSLKR